MKKNIAILGSTGSIGQTTLEIINKKKECFKDLILVANKNYNKINFQIKKYNPKIFIVTNKNTYLKIYKKFNRRSNIKIFNSFNELKFKNKLDITVSAIPGIAGLKPTIMFTKHSKKILLANKESIICGWDLINKTSKKYKTEIIPIDSEHFSISKLIKNYDIKDIEKIYITASGGPFLKLPLKKFKFIKPKDAIKHPKWKMGNKISVDSATLMNKVLELLEAYKLFSFNKKIYEVIIHPQSLVHAIVKFKNGITKLLYHEPDMKIPIANAIFNFDININKLNKTKNSKKSNNTFFKDLLFEKVDPKRFPIIKIVPKLNIYKSTGIIINAANEILIDHFLKKKITFNSISKYLFKVIKNKNYKKYAIKQPVDLSSILAVDKWARVTTINQLKNK